MLEVLIILNYFCLQANLKYRLRENAHRKKDSKMRFDYVLSTFMSVQSLPEHYVVSQLPVKDKNQILGHSFTK